MSIFSRLFERKNNLTISSDIKNSVDTAKREGIAEGMEKRSLEIARKMLAKGIDEATVKEITGLSAEHILQLKAEI